MAGSIVCFILMILAHKKKQISSQLYWTVNLYLAFRSTLRLFDFEQTRDSFEPAESWYSFCMVQIICGFGLVYVMALLHKGNRFTNTIAFLMLWWIAICMLSGLYGTDMVDELKNRSLTIALSICFYCYPIYVIQEINNEFLEAIYGILKHKS